MQPTTLAAGIILAAACVAAVVYSTSSSTSTAPAAARVGPSVITTAQVEDEVNAILAVPAYRQALRGLGTVSLAAPVSPKAVAAANGDPDDLLITFSPAKGVPISRPFTREDLAASVLTRLLYVTSLQQVLARRHVRPTAAQMADGVTQARVEAGFGPGGAGIYDQLPSWYQAQLANRAADIEALAESVAGGPSMPRPSRLIISGLRSASTRSCACGASARRAGHKGPGLTKAARPWPIGRPMWPPGSAGSRWERRQARSATTAGRSS